MNPLSIALLATQIAGTLWPMIEPLAAKGIDALIADLKAKRPASMPEIKKLADHHGVDLEKVMAFAEPFVMGGVDGHAARMATLPAGHMGLSFGGFFSDIGSVFTAFRNWLADPKTTAAIENVETVAVALICELASVAGLSASIMSEVGTGQSAQGTTNKIRVASSAICTALGGTLTGEKVSNAPAVTSVT